MERLGATRTRPGRRPQFNHTKETGAYVRAANERGGIDWYRYQKHIMIPKLIPFAQECAQSRPGTLVQEDNAPAHASKYQVEVYALYEISRLLWPPNSPDLNMIEPCWWYMKRETTKNGPLKGKEAHRAAWVKCWKEMPQTMIQAWIERIIVHIQDVIRLEGGNEYKEGRNKGKPKRRVY
jgi:transposase